MMEINEMARKINETARTHGFWPETTERNMLLGLKIALIQSEATEALEALRSNHEDHVGEEIADIIIRALDLAWEMGFDDMESILEDKMAKNHERPFRHGKLF